MKKNSIKDMVKTQKTYEKGVAAIKKAGGIKQVRKKLKSK